MSFLVSVVLLTVAYPWPTQGSSSSLEARVSPPAGFQRVAVKEDSFARWLRKLPIRKGHPPVRLYTGALKGNQKAHYAVLDIDVGKKDLQQCADATMRLWAEYLWSLRKVNDICFRFTNGDLAHWAKWESGIRPKVKGTRVTWSRRQKADSSYKNFRRYLETVFTYAGTYSLKKELRTPKGSGEIRAGDVFITGGFPGHAVMVMDVAANAAGQRKFLLAQSYMPAQEIHILKQPGSNSPWYPSRDNGVLETPEWTFRYEDLRRFSSESCP